MKGDIKPARRMLARATMAVLLVLFALAFVGCHSEPNSASSSQATTASISVNPGSEEETTSELTIAPLENIQYDYVIDAASKVFHSPDCPAIEDIRGSDQQMYTSTRDDLIRQGFAPCETCES